MHRILMIAFSLFTVFNLFAAGPDTAIAPAIVEAKIAEGIQAHRVEAFVAREIHQVTHKYDEELNTLLEARTKLEIPETSDAADSIKTYKSVIDRPRNTRIMGFEAEKLIKALLIDLWTLNTTDSLRCIKAFTFAESKCSDYKEELFLNKRFFKLCVQSFYHSRTLFGFIIAPQIVSLYDPEFNPSESFVERICLDGTSEKPVNIQEKIREIMENGHFFPTNKYNFYLKSQDKTYVVTFKKKTRGAHFGGYVTLKTDPQLPNLRRYFVKAYHGYPAKKDLNSEKAFRMTTTGICSDEDKGSGIKEAPYQPVDLKELFIYKVLQLIGLGPKVYFLINPYLKDGIFIITEDLNTDDTEFVEMGKMPNGLKTFVNPFLLRMRNGILPSKEYMSFEAVTSMLEIDTINRIFYLTDANDGNFGYIDHNVEDEIIDEDAAKKWLQQHHDFRIIDFLVPGTSDSYVVSNIYDTFLEGNSTTNYEGGQVMDNAVCRKIAIRGISDAKKQKLQQKHRAEKLFFGEKVIESLDKRFKQQGGLNSLLQAAKQFVAEFIRPNGKYTIADTVGLSNEYVDDSLADLDAYISGISENYETLGKAIRAAIKEDAKLQPHVQNDHPGNAL